MSYKLFGGFKLVKYQLLNSLSTSETINRIYKKR